MRPGALCVMTPGQDLMQQWLADSWDSQQLVNISAVTYIVQFAVTQHSVQLNSIVCSYIAQCAVIQHSVLARGKLKHYAVWSAIVSTICDKCYRLLWLKLHQYDIIQLIYILLNTIQVPKLFLVLLLARELVPFFLTTLFATAERQGLQTVPIMDLVCITVCTVRMQDCAARHHHVCTTSIVIM